MDEILKIDYYYNFIPALDEEYNLSFSGIENCKHFFITFGGSRSSNTTTYVYLNNNLIISNYNPVSFTIIGILKDNEYKLNVSGGYGNIRAQAGGVYLNNSVCPKNNINTFKLTCNNNNVNYTVSAIGF